LKTAEKMEKQALEAAEEAKKRQKEAEEESQKGELQRLIQGQFEIEQAIALQAKQKSQALVCVCFLLTGSCEVVTGVEHSGDKDSQDQTRGHL